MSGSKLNGTAIDRLYEVIESRKSADPDESYTAKLFSRGKEKIVQKMGEEAVETVIAAMSGDKREIAEESADLLYHLLVLWAETGVRPDDVYDALAKRKGVSGLEEKSRRGSGKKAGN